MHSFGGEHLTEIKELSVLAEADVTQQIIVNEPVTTYEESLAKLKSVTAELEEALSKIQAAIDKQVATDQELGNYVF